VFKAPLVPTYRSTALVIFCSGLWCYKLPMQIWRESEWNHF